MMRFFWYQVAKVWWGPKVAKAVYTAPDRTEAIRAIRELRTNMAEPRTNRVTEEGR